jgi:putative FmdB family regulatory protein
MPAYAFRCKPCNHEFEIFFRHYSAYDNATITCPECGSEELARVINRVNVAGAKAHNYADMSSQEMLSVLESGNRRDVDDMFNQVRGTSDAQQHQPRNPSSSETDSGS